MWLIAGLNLLLCCTPTVEAQTAPAPTPVTLTVTTVGGKYYINGAQQTAMNLNLGVEYIFNLDDATNNNHPFKLSTTADGTHGGGTEITTVTKSTNYDTSFGSTQTRSLTYMPTAAGSIYYYCGSHSNMGGELVVAASTTSTEVNPISIIAAGATLVSTNTYKVIGEVLSIQMMHTADAGRLVNFTTDGSDPATHGSPYTSPLVFVQAGTYTIRTISTFMSGATATKDMVFLLEYQPVISPIIMADPGTNQTVISTGHYLHTGSVIIQITQGESGSSLNYTTDGTDPANYGQNYTGPITFNQPGSYIIRVVAYKQNRTATHVQTTFDVTYSHVMAATIATLNHPNKTQISPIRVKHIGTATVEIVSPEVGSQVNYTIDGSDPELNGQNYTGSFTFTQIGTYVVRAAANKQGMFTTLSILTVEVQWEPVAEALITSQDNTAPYESKTEVSPNYFRHVGSVTIEIAMQEENASMNFTVDGSSPAVTLQNYTGPVTFTTPGTYVIRVLTFKDGKNPVEVQAKFVLTWANVAPAIITSHNATLPDTSKTMISPTYYRHEGTVTIELAKGQADSNMHFTTNNTDPLQYGDVFTTPFTYTQPGTYIIRAVTTRTGMNPTETTVTFELTWATVARPSFTPDGGTFEATTDVTMAVTTGGATIVYDTDGSTPVCNPNVSPPVSTGNVWAGTPVTIASASTAQITLQAVACKVTHACLM